MRKRYVTVERLEEVARNALAGGYGRLEYYEDNGAPRRLVTLTIKHDCQNPYLYEIHARYSAAHHRRVRPMMIRGTARCRKCEACLDYRAWQWTSRAKSEMATSGMTLFGTFTMSPEQHYLLDAQIVRGTRLPDGRWRRPPCDIRALSADEVFTKRVQAFGDRLTEYLWRIRKGRDGVRPAVRYLLVAERHDGDATSDVMRGRPHYHVMLHTDTSGTLVRGDPLANDGEWFVNKRGEIFVADTAWLRRQWQFGFTKFQLATSGKAAWYVCKYISKSLTCRVRASQRYGIRGVDTEHPDQMLDRREGLDPPLEEENETNEVD